MKVFNFGSINIDRVYRVPHLVTPGETLASVHLETVLGGKGANQSVALARAGISVSHLGRLGRTDAWARDELKASGVDVSAVELMNMDSGHAIIQVDDQAENAIILHGGANQTFDRDVLSAALQGAEAGDWLLLQNECNAIDRAFELAEQYQLRIAFNPAPITPSVHQLPLHQVELLIVNETEVMGLAGVNHPERAAEALSRRLPEVNLVVTLGGRGALAHCQGQHYQQDAIAIEAVDTTGAGDTFTGYYLAALIQGHDHSIALRRACVAAALAVSRAGASPSIPTADAVDAFEETAHA